MRATSPALVAVLAVGLVMAFAPEAAGNGGGPAARQTLFDEAKFDPRHNAITIPFHGPAPQPALFELAPDHQYYEMDNAHLTGKGLQLVKPGTDVLKFTMANRPDHDAVRISWELKRAGHPEFLVDNAGHRLTIWPFGRGAAAAAPTPPPAGSRMVVGTPYMGPTRDILVLPYQGAFTHFHSRINAQDPSWVELDFEPAEPIQGKPRTGTLTGPDFDRWELLKVAGQDITRLRLRRKRMIDLAGQLKPDQHMLWIRERATANQATPRPTAKPTAKPTPRPTARPTPRVTPPPTPRPTPAYLPTPEPAMTPYPVQTPQIGLPTPAPFKVTPAPRGTPPLQRPQPWVAPPEPSPTPTPRPTPKPTPRAPRVVKTAFKGMYFDPSRQALVLPFTGDVPAYSLAQAGGTVLYVDFPTARSGEKEAVMQTFDKPTLLTNWLAADNLKEEVFRVTLNLQQRGEVLVAVDGIRRELLLIPQLLSALEKAPPPPGTEVTTVFMRGAYDAKTNAVAIPYYGTTPMFVVENVAPGTAYIDFLNAAITPVGVQTQAVPNFPLLTFWLMAKRPEQNIVRVSMTLPFGGHVDVLDDQANKRLFLVPQLGPAAAPTALPTPQPTPTVPVRGWF
ncbi:MAG: hypothetical protein JWM80_1172 [Cyanobacteria bacterium RYN_339]|nr:hypothetical protein [Cyanobacteria bacterium RYN_339]